MKFQQYLQEQFIGQDKSKQNILDEIYKAAKDGYKDKIGYIPLKPMALITVHEPKSPIIESIGFSEPDDLLTNIFGAAFSGMLNGGGNVDRGISDENGVVRFIRLNSTTSNRYTNNSFGGNGVRMQIGRGNSIARSDFNLDDPFVVAPESQKFEVNSGGWLSGSQTVVVNGLLSGVTTSDSIGECALWGLWLRDNTASSHFLLSHDAAGGSFSSGQNVNVTYTWSIS